MSLIEEALRRIKEPIPGQPHRIPPRAAQPPQQDESASVHSWPVTQRPLATTSRAPQNNLAIMAMTVLGLAAILLIGGIVWMLSRDTASLPTVVQPPSALTATPPTTPDAPLAEEKSPALAADQLDAAMRKPLKAATRAQGELAVSGVIEGLGDPYAVINGMIVGVGDAIAGVVVVSIGNGEVTARRSDGSNVTLRVQR